MEGNNNMNYKPYDPSASQTLSQYTARVFGWMFTGLMLTFVVSMAVVYSGLYVITCSGYMPIILAAAELIAVIYLSARIHDLSTGAALGLFLGYSVLNGLTLSSIFVYYSVSSLIFVFLMTAVYFGIMALYGAMTKTDLTRIRPILVGGLIAVLIISILSLFLPISQVAISIVAVALFVAFTAYDTQMIRRDYYYYQGNSTMLEKASIISALTLYLDFINLFLHLLQLFGKGRD